MQRICFYLVVAFWSVALVDCAGGTSRALQADVVDRSYMPAHFDSDGDYVSAKYTLMVRTWDGTEEVSTTATGYYDIKPGQHITYRVRTGWLSNHDWFPSY